MLSYQRALDYILGLANYETSVDTQAAAARFNLQTVKQLATLSGWQSGQYIHIAGTKGKGSTAAMLEAILRSAGYRTGLFTSPHLHSFRERIRVAGEMISGRDVARWTVCLRPLVEQLRRDNPSLCPVTTFDFLVVMALCYFVEQGVDLAIMEAGLGGRLDATNVIQPLVSVITSISYDHTQILGDTLAKIAAEKAGIIKSEGTVVVAPQEMEALTIIEERCLQQQARLILVGRDYQWRIASDGLEVRGLNSVHSHLYLPLLGDHQIVNAVTAIAAAEALAQYGYIVSHEAIQSGLATVSWPGRLEMLRRRPLIIADGAHNADSARKLSLALPATLGVSRAHIILGTSSDKDVEGIVRGLAPVASTFTLVRSRHPRAAPIEKMEEAIAPWGVPVSHSATVADALESLRSVIPAGDTILVTGSLFVVAEAREALGFRSINRRYRR